ncbi:hypothetical protein ACLOJK_037643 [Asimina triloba]
MAQKEHIILFPSLGQGHFIPFMALAALLDHRYHYAVTYVSTPANIHSLQSTLPPNSTIRLATLPFHGPDHGLPPDKETAELLPHPLGFRLLEASQTLQPAFESLILEISREHGRTPLAIISDMFNSWTVEIANQLGIFQAIFVVSGAYGTAIYFSLWLNLPHTRTDSNEFTLPDFSQTVVIQRNQLATQFKVANETDFILKFHHRLLPLCWRADGFLFNTFEELEKTGLEYFRSKSGGKPVWAIGPLKNIAQGRKKPGVSAESCITWLDLHPPNSALFVSFGSHNTIGAPQMKELAMGLEATGRPFIWVVRPPLGFDRDGEFRAEWLPEGFEERISERKQGILVRHWGPQLEILAHRSTGVFLSHCGWNSTTESLSRGVPMIGWPMSGEQFYNVKMMEELGVCVEMARGNSADIGTNDVERVIELVMGGTNKWEEMKKKALQLKEMIELAVREDEECKGSSAKALDEFLKAISAKAETKM